MRFVKQLLTATLLVCLVATSSNADSNKARRFQRANGYRGTSPKHAKVLYQVDTGGFSEPEGPAANAIEGSESASGAPSTATPSVVPSTGFPSTSIVPPNTTMAPGEIIIESSPSVNADPHAFHVYQGEGSDVVGPSHGGCAGCENCTGAGLGSTCSVNPNGCTGCDDCLGRPYGYKSQLRQGLGLDHLSFFAGVNGFKSQATRGEAGSFGFREGVNFGTFGRGIILPPSFGYQIGFSASQTDISGASFTDAQRNQTYLTTGIYRRGDRGLQGGVVFDYLNDDWYFNDLGVSQVRGEIAMAISDRQSYGIWFATAVGDDTKTSALLTGNVDETWETEDLYAFFYRSRMVANGAGEMRLFAGWTGDRDGLIGADTKLPLQNGFAIETDFTYLVPNEDRGSGGNSNEAWNIGVNLAWYPGSLAFAGRRYHRPLFDVANNGSMILRRK